MMKKLCCVLLALALLCGLAGCSDPDSLQLDLSRGYGDGLKLIHLNASSKDKRERILAFQQVLEDPTPLEKDVSLFAYYPDYKLELRTGRGSPVTTAIVDLNGDWVDFIYPDSPGQIYRSRTTAAQFRSLVNRV